MSIARSSREISSSYWYVQYATLAADKDLLLDGPGGGTNGASCRQIRIGSAGTLVVLRPDGATVTITGLGVGEYVNIQANKIVASGTTVTSALVLW